MYLFIKHAKKEKKPAYFYEKIFIYQKNILIGYKSKAFNQNMIKY